MNNVDFKFSISYRILELSNSIMYLIGKLENKIAPFVKENRIKSIYSSCAIEANSLSLEEVRDVIDGKNVIGPLREITEVKNAYSAYEKIQKINPYKIDDLKYIHSILTDGLIENPGEWRDNEEGVFDGDKCIFLAPPPRLVPELMSDLFEFLNNNKKELSLLILSSVFHYEFVFIHPFKDGNGRTARLWQTAILGKLNPIFYYLPIENYIEKYQDEYYDSIDRCNKNGNSTLFIEFMLKMILKTLESLDKDINSREKSYSSYVKKLLSVMEQDVPYTANEILELLNLKSKETLRRNYLDKAIELNLVRLEIEDKPTSKNQRYIRK